MHDYLLNLFFIDRYDGFINSLPVNPALTSIIHSLLKSRKGHFLHQKNAVDDRLNRKDMSKTCPTMRELKIFIQLLLLSIIFMIIHQLKEGLDQRR